MSSSPMLDGDGVEMFTASSMLVLPSDCWDYFGSYDFWQANVRVSQVVPTLTGGTTTAYYTSFDLGGLECLGAENGAAASWFGFIGQGCAKTYSNSNDEIPYLVMRIDGYTNGLAAGRSSSLRSSSRLPSASEKPKENIKLSPIEPLDPEVLKALHSGQKLPSGF